VGRITRFMTIDEVADLVRCEHRTVRRAIKRGELEAAFIGGKWLVRPAAVDSWFEARCAGAAGATDGSGPRVRRITGGRGDRPGSVARLQAIEKR
jgi:excisionase family DNA binding protein